MKHRLVISILLLIALCFNAAAVFADSNDNIENDLCKAPSLTLGIVYNDQARIYYRYDYEYATLQSHMWDDHMYIDSDDFAILLQQAQALTKDRTYKMYKAGNEYMIDEYAMDIDNKTIELKNQYILPSAYYFDTDRYFIPLRAVFEQLGFKVDYYQEDQLIQISKDYYWDDKSLKVKQ